MNKLLLEEHFDYLGKNANIFSFFDIIYNMRYGLLTLGLFTTIQTIGFAYYLYRLNFKPKPPANPEPEPEPQPQPEAEPFIQLEPIDGKDKQENILEQLKMLSVKKKELNDLCSKITSLQDDIEKIREQLEDLNRT
jgi:hypothetical protein